MARNPRQTVLYEVIRRQRNSGTEDRKSWLSVLKNCRKNRLTDQKTEKQPSGGPDKPSGAAGLRRPVLRPASARSKIPYLIIGLLILAAVLALWVIIKISPKDTGKEQKIPDLQTKAIQTRENPDMGGDLAAARSSQTSGKGDTPIVEKEQTPQSTGDHIIVIVQYASSRDLEPVKKYFADNGIKTRIENKGDYYLLTTKNKYQNPKRQGTDGYKILQKIKEVGKKYKAPSGYEPFSSTPFQDAYPKKVK